MADYKTLYEQQQQETDIEHQRYLETAERYSNKLWEVCQELDIENDDTSKNIIEAINKLKEENKKLKEEKDVLNTTYTKTLKRRNWDASERKKLKEENEALETALTIVKEENETNKNNLQKFMKENKKLKQEAEEFYETIEELKEEIQERTTYCVLPEEGQFMKENEELKEENKKLKEQYQPKGSRIDAEGLHDFMNETIEELKEENKKLKEQVKKIEEEEYDPDNEDHVLVDDDIETESEEEKDKYDGDDWHWVYGNTIVEQEEYKEFVLIMAGGGDHWENWTMTPTMNYIVNKDGKHPQHGQVLVQSSCGKYVSFQDKDYECDEDECIIEYEIAVEC